MLIFFRIAGSRGVKKNGVISALASEVMLTGGRDDYEGRGLNHDIAKNGGAGVKPRTATLCDIESGKSYR